jgi:hypothetical protein
MFNFLTGYTVLSGLVQFTLNIRLYHDMGLYEFVLWRMNMLWMSQYQPRLSSITNVAPSRSAYQIAVFTSK